MKVFYLTPLHNKSALKSYRPCLMLTDLVDISFFLKNFLRNTRFLDRQLLGSGHFCHPLIFGNFAFYLDDEIGGKTTLDVEGFKLEVLKITSYQIFLI